MTTELKLREMPSDLLHKELKIKTANERELLAEIICYIHEVDRRKIYLKYNYTSLYEYLVTEMKYSNASAQRRIDAARLMNDVPELTNELASGELTLNQVGIVSMGLKQAKKENGATSSAKVKRELLNQVKTKTTFQAQSAVAKALDLQVQTFEKKTGQSDESLRVEITFSKEEVQQINQMRDAISHSHPNASIKEIFMLGLQELRKKKGFAAELRRGGTSAAEVKNKSKAQLRRDVFAKHKHCQWKFANGQVCGSTFQLQVDHKKSQWLGGSDDESNLQLLCSTHNRFKYQQEIGLF